MPDQEALALEVSPFQERVLALPETYDLFLGGGRGGAKSYTLALLALRHTEQYGARARILYLRQSHKGTADFESLCLDLYGRIFGRAIRFNAQEGLFRFPNGATLEINQLEGPQDYGKYQGRSFTLVLIDEAGQWSAPDLIDKLRSNLRGPKNMPLRCIVAANPGDVGHQWLAKRYVFKTKPWMPFDEPHSKTRWLYAPSTFIDNPFIDQAAYRKQLEASCPSDPELLRAWLAGDWAVARGAYFAAVLDESRNAVDPWDAIPKCRGEPWEAWFSLDWGSSAPAVVYLGAKSPGATAPDGRFYPRGSIVLVDELATNEPGNLNKGLLWTVPKLAEGIKDMAKRWRVRARGVADDACFAHAGHSSGSIADEFELQNVYFNPAKKSDRVSGWTHMRTMLAAAGSVDQPGLYISRRCEYFWQTVPYLSHDLKKREDVSSSGADHGADSCRYLLLREKRVVTMTEG